MAEYLKTQYFLFSEKSEKENEKEKVNGTSKTNGTVPNNPKTLKGDIFTKKNARREREKKMKAKRLKAVEEAQVRMVYLIFSLNCCRIQMNNDPILVV